MQRVTRDTRHATRGTRNAKCERNTGGGKKNKVSTVWTHCSFEFRVGRKNPGDGRRFRHE